MATTCLPDCWTSPPSDTGPLIFVQNRSTAKPAMSFSWFPQYLIFHSQRQSSGWTIRMLYRAVCRSTSRQEQPVR
jgi:hypothetical protein